MNRVVWNGSDVLVGAGDFPSREQMLRNYDLYARKANQLVEACAPEDSEGGEKLFTLKINELAVACANKAVEFVKRAKDEQNPDGDERMSMDQFNQVAKQWRELTAEAAHSVGVDPDLRIIPDSHTEDTIKTLLPEDIEEANTQIAEFVQTVAQTEVCNQLSMPQFSVQWNTIGNIVQFNEDEYRILDELIGRFSTCVIVMPSFESPDGVTHVKPVVMEITMDTDFEERVKSFKFLYRMRF